MKMEQTGVPKRRHIKVRCRGNYPEENIQHTKHGKSFKSRIVYYSYFNSVVMNYGLPFWVTQLTAYKFSECKII
jgi:hypothetical protein